MAVIPKLAFKEFKKELESPNTVLIDVRERDELKTDGKIPKSKNIPLGEVETAFKMDASAFKATYNFDKPSTDQNIIVHCMKGIRAMKGATAMNQAGFPNVKVYSGMQDWVANGGKIEQ